MQPAAHIVIPNGATHFSSSHEYPFEKHTVENGFEQRYVYMGYSLSRGVVTPVTEYMGTNGDGWLHIENHPRIGWRNGHEAINPPQVTPDMQQCMTPDGLGWVFSKDSASVLILFDASVTKYQFSPVRYNLDDVTLVRTRTRNIAPQASGVLNTPKRGI